LAYPNKKQLILFIGPIFLFTLFFPRFEHKIYPEAGLVLGAFAKAPVSSVVDELPRGASATVLKTLETNKEFKAKAVLVYEVNSDTILFSQTPDQQLQIASLTKLMTALVSQEDPSFYDPITVTAADQLNVSPNLRLRIGDQVYPHDLVRAMLVGSANDAAVALANHFPNKQVFVDRMNAKAVELGMNSTKFSNPMGFDSASNYSTATDVLKLVKYALPKLPYQQVWENKDYAFTSELGGRYVIKNSSRLNHTSIKSIKTGNSKGALGNMVVQLEPQNDRKYILIVLGATNREAVIQEVADFVLEGIKN
jgi:serine-type D-Ala-D-Ala carboxypeptidase (penicillin-binding protein 5/6)